jgi:valyl-tRNA synthetase
MALSTKYNPAEVEDKWYQEWMKNGFFKAAPNSSKEPFCIVMPPPNVTGVLHMGHMLNNTIQDVLIRKARMEGKEACWVPGTDHASIATEAKVVGMLREKGIRKSSLGRDEFLKYAWEWKEKYGGIILDQLKKLGASCDWDRTGFTMNPDYYKAVIRVFVDLYNKGYIYRGLRMINWDCEAKTALSNEEVLYKEDGEKSILYSVKYKISGQRGPRDAQDDWVIIATQRPETIMGDVAIAVNPTDERYKDLVGKKVLVPFINREIPVIADDYVDKTFGTGCLKVTPAHDVNDYEIGLRHKLPVIDTINDDGTLNGKCEILKFIGKDRFAVRKDIVKDLRESGQLVKEEEFITRIGRSERTNSVVEPKLSLQWFVKMKEISRRAYRAVEDDEIKLYPAKYKNTYRYWMENVRDWCISRQLWWGHRIPAYYYGPGENDFVVAESIEEAAKLANVTPDKLTQDSDVLDTWASSWLWPEEVFFGFKDDFFDKKTGKIIKGKNKDLDYFYPTQVLVTAPEILFFWVARMIIAGYEYTDEKPFSDVYLTGVVRDKLGRKMSKSLGNSPDPLDLIAKFGADGVRAGMLFSSAAGNDLLYDDKLCEQGWNFSNKIWNAFRLVKGWEVTTGAQPAENKVAVDWFKSKLNQTIAELEDHFKKFRISDALMTVYKLIWDDFCSWYLEMVKPEYGKPIDETTYKASITFFETVLKVLHPFMPFISEELWSELAERKSKDYIIVAAWPKSDAFNNGLITEGDTAFSIITQVRNVRANKGLSPKETLNLYQNADAPIGNFWPVVKKLANINHVNGQKPVGSSFLIDRIEFTVQLEGKIDVEKEKEEIQKEIAYFQGFLTSVDKKLSNEKFVNGAPPAVIENERKKKADAEAKIKTLEERLKSL